MQNEFESCDGALWHIVSNADSTEIESTIYNYQDKYIKPDELGYKYHVLTYKENDYGSAEVLCAYIGDVKHFIDNHGKAGYNGMMVKNKVIPKKDIKQMFRKILSNWQFPEITIKEVVKQV